MTVPIITNHMKIGKYLNTQPLDSPDYSVYQVALPDFPELVVYPHFIN